MALEPWRVVALEKSRCERTVVVPVPYSKTEERAGATILSVSWWWIILSVGSSSEDTEPERTGRVCTVVSQLDLTFDGADSS